MKELLENLFPEGVPASILDGGPLVMVALLVGLFIKPAWDTIQSHIKGAVQILVNKHWWPVVLFTYLAFALLIFQLNHHVASFLTALLGVLCVSIWRYHRRNRYPSTTISSLYAAILLSATLVGILIDWPLTASATSTRVIISTSFDRGSLDESDEQLRRISLIFRDILSKTFEGIADIQPESYDGDKYKRWREGAARNRLRKGRDSTTFLLSNFARNLPKKEAPDGIVLLTKLVLIRDSELTDTTARNLEIGAQADIRFLLLRASHSLLSQLRKQSDYRLDEEEENQVRVAILGSLSDLLYGTAKLQSKIDEKLESGRVRLFSVRRFSEIDPIKTPLI